MIKKIFMKQKIKSVLNQTYSTVMKLSFSDATILKKQKGLKEFKVKLELFYDEIKGIKPTNKDPEIFKKDGKVVLNKDFNSYNTLLEIYTDKLSKPKDNKQKVVKQIHMKNSFQKIEMEMKTKDQLTYQPCDQ